ncbi:MAG: type I glyceraldehyde-3-phosphate dehydrogenase [Synergistaceae bacterium]|jgi:glyceraldehyde 3-phosphate dehydrogenase/glyceraldehyde-3-phosphate dehydrogenase (NAD(P))|nr:type I glyceraldehyde-3-phosphate dehydrogenase [Synergistaceae bacterium]
MAVKVAINGLGRIGRIVLRCWVEKGLKDIEIVGVNDLISAQDMAYYIKYDSTHGKAPFEVKAEEGALILGGKKIPMCAEKDPTQLPWKSLGADIVMECTGRFTKKDDAAKHVEAGAKHVIISAPAEGDLKTIVLGVNEKDYDPKSDAVISNASCTTNSIAPVTKVMHETFGIEKLMATTIHAYTATQYLVDTPKKGGGRKGRAAGISLVPATTGAAKAMIPLFPDLKGKMDMISVRVPTIDGSLTDANYLLKRSVTADEVKAALKKAADGFLKNIVEFCEDEIVSADIISNPHSGIVDALSTKVVDGNLVKVMVWYDNEFGYSNRMLDLAAYIGKK